MSNEETKPRRMGFDALDDAEFVSGGYEGSSRLHDFFIGVDPARGITEGRKAVLFLDEDPAMVWEHDLYSITRNMGDRHVCLTKNSIADRCPLCELDKDLKAVKGKDGKAKFSIWSRLVGYLTVIDCGDVVRDKATGDVKLVPYIKGDKRYIFGKKLLRANRGSTEKPGMLLALRRLREENKNRLTGRVFYAFRAGKLYEGIGNEYRTVEDGDAFPIWKGLDLSDEAAVEKANARLRTFLAGLAGSPAEGPNDKMLEYVDIRPADYDATVFASISVAEMEKLAAKLRAQIGLGGGSASTSNTGSSGGDWGDPDSDVPF